MDNVVAREGIAGEAGSGLRLYVLFLDPALRLPDRPDNTRSHDLARRLHTAGHRVSVLTTTAALPALPPNTDFVLDTIPVRGTALAGFPLDPAVRAGFARGLAWRIWRYRDVDALVAMDCPSAALLLAVIFSWLRGIPLMLDQRSPSPTAPRTATRMQRFSACCARLGLRIAAARARSIFAGSQEIREALLAAGIPPEKILASPLGSDATIAQQRPPAAPLNKLVLYAGPMEAGAGLEELVAVAGALPGVTFSLCGDGPAREPLAMLAREHGVLDKNVFFRGPLARHERAAALAAATVAVVSAAHRTNEASAPFYDGLATAKPLVLLGDGPLRELIEARGAGIALPPDIAAAARELGDFLADADGLRRASQQAAALAAGRFAFERVAAEFRGTIEQAVAAAPRALVLRRRMLTTKRVIDIAASALGLIVLSPVLVVLMAAVWIWIGWPPLFVQTRPGLRGAPFKLYKLRTMTKAKDASGALLDDAQRLTPLGAFLRRTSLDELPELFNVLRGDMSLIGPRPLLMEYLSHYTPEQRRRHELRPGITGWSQIHGRNALSWEERFKHDVWYVDNLSLWLDAKIALRTVWIIITGRGISAPGHATMPRFDEIIARREGAEDV